MLHDSKRPVGTPAGGYRGRLTATVSRHLRSQHLITGAVAVGLGGIGFAGGGSSEIGFSAASILVWCAVLVGVAAGVFPRSDPPRGAIAVGTCLAALVALIGISLAYTTDPGSGFKDLVRAAGYLGLFVLVVVASRRTEARPWLHGLAIGLALVAVIALGGRLLPSVFGDGDLEVSALPGAEGRLSWPIGYWNGLAAAMALALVLFAWLGTSARTRIGRALATGGLAAPLLAIYLCTSRGGFAAAAIGLAILVLTMRPRAQVLIPVLIGSGAGAAAIAFARTKHDLTSTPGTELARTQGAELLVVLIAAVLVAALLRYALDGRIVGLGIPRRAARSAAVVAAGIGLAVLVAADPAERWEDFKQPPPADVAAQPGGPELARATSSGRYQFWSTALDAFAEHPLTGIGASEYEPYWYRHGGIQLVTRNAHSLFLESLAELGIAGGLASLGFFGAAGFVGSRRLGLDGGDLREQIAPALGLLAAGGAAAAVEWTWNLPAVFGPVVVAAALLAGPATLPALEREGSPAMAFIRSRRRFFVGVGVLLAAWAAICASGIVLLAERSLEHGRAANGRADYADAIAEAREAIDLAPWSAEPWAFLAQTYQLAGDLPRAQNAIEEAIERSSDDWRLWTLATQIEIAANDLADARLAYERTYELIPEWRPTDFGFEELVALSQY